jgi:hypothetical protein
MGARGLLTALCATAHPRGSTNLRSSNAVVVLGRNSERGTTRRCRLDTPSKAPQIRSVSLSLIQPFSGVLPSTNQTAVMRHSAKFGRSMFSCRRPDARWGEDKTVVLLRLVWWVRNGHRLQFGLLRSGIGRWDAVEYPRPSSHPDTPRRIFETRAPAHVARAPQGNQAVQTTGRRSVGQWPLDQPDIVGHEGDDCLLERTISRGERPAKFAEPAAEFYSPPPRRQTQPPNVMAGFDRARYTGLRASSVPRKRCPSGSRHGLSERCRNLVGWSNDRGPGSRNDRQKGPPDVGLI